MTALGQLALPFPEIAAFDPADFVAAEANAEAMAWLRQVGDWPGGRLVVWGEAGCGKTHLLHVWAAANGAPVISGGALGDAPELAVSGGLAIDDADMVADEAGLLHRLNAASEHRVAVLLSARTAPASWRIALPDLASRVRATTAVRIQAPDDALLRVLLARSLHARQLIVAEAVQDWVRLRLPRTAAAMTEAAARLDAAALAGQTAITRALAARVLEGMMAAIPASEDYR